MRHSPLALALALALPLWLGAAAEAQTMPSPSPSPSSSPNPLGEPSFGPNDPCTTISAVVTRPTVTNSVCTVKSNHLDVEVGYENTAYGDGGGTTVLYPQPLLRMGTPIRALELDLIMPGFERTTTGGPLLTGATDAGVGLKYFIGASPKFSYSAQANLTIPSGTNGISNGGTTTYYALNGSYTLSPVFSIATTVGVNNLTNGTSRWSSVIPSLVVSASLPGATSVYAEDAAFTNAFGPSTSTRMQYIVGVSRGIGPRAQVDVETGFSPTKATGRYQFVGFGLGLYL